MTIALCDFRIVIADTLTVKPIGKDDPIAFVAEPQLQVRKRVNEHRCHSNGGRRSDGRPIGIAHSGDSSVIGDHR